MILYFHGELEKNSGWRHKSCYCKFIYLFDDILFFKVSGQCLSQLPIAVFRSWLNFGHQLNPALWEKKFPAPAPVPWS